MIASVQEAPALQVVRKPDAHCLNLSRKLSLFLQHLVFLALFLHFFFLFFFLQSLQRLCRINFLGSIFSPQQLQAALGELPVFGDVVGGCQSGVGETVGGCHTGAGDTTGGCHTGPGGTLGDDSDEGCGVIFCCRLILDAFLDTFLNFFD